MKTVTYAIVTGGTTIDELNRTLPLIAPGDFKQIMITGAHNTRLVRHPVTNKMVPRCMVHGLHITALGQNGFNSRETIVPAEHVKTVVVTGKKSGNITYTHN